MPLKKSIMCNTRCHPGKVCGYLQSILQYKVKVFRTTEREVLLVFFIVLYTVCKYEYMLTDIKGRPNSGAWRL